MHTAGAFGEDDKVVTDREGIEAVMPVGKDGRFTFPVTDYEGMQVFDSNLQIIDHLKAATAGAGATGSVTPGTVLVRRETYDHSYPHCWRCRQPLIYKGVSSWFVEVTKVKERLIALNQDIRWVPEHIKDGQFGKWLENARDWSITRNRFWGSPVPVWKSDDEHYPRIDVYGSFEDIERDFGRLPVDKDGNPDLHRPFVDDLTRPNPDDPRSPAEGQSTMRRVTDVLDVWFDSGSMSFAQVHYPFENKDWFDNHFPGDFIVEYIGQTRGWFYTMHVLAGAIFDRPAFSTCLSHGIVLGNDGQKMSKSLRNYPDVREVFDRDGADAMRWFLMSSPILRGGNLVVTEQGIRDSVRQVLIPLWNSWSFFSLYANAAGGGSGHEATWRTDSVDPMDRYILAKLRDYVAAMTDQLDNYEVAAACDSTRGFLDVLTNWYIRRSRERFWDEDADAFDTLYTVLEVVCRVTAPLMPLTTEEVWRGLTGERSVHLTDWPSADDLPADDALATAMDAVRDVCSAGSALRKAANLRNRLPLQSLTVVVPDASGLAGFDRLVADELNLKEVRLLDLDTPEAAAYGVEQRLTVNARAAGPRLGKDVQLAIKGSKTGDWSVAEDGTVTSGGLALVEGEYALDTVAGDASGGTATGVLPRGGFVVLDTDVTPELEAEGTARDLVRAVQQARKDAGLAVSDRISLTVSAPAETLDAARTHEALIAAETLASSVAYADAAGGGGRGREGLRSPGSGRQPAEGARRERDEHGCQHQRPGERDRHGVVGQDPVGDPGRVAEQLAARRGRGRDGVPLRQEPQPGRHVLGRDEHARQEADRPDQDLHRHHAALAAQDQAEEDPQPQQREAEPEQQAHRQQALRPRPAGAPPDQQAARHQHEQLDGRVGQVGPGAAERHRDAADRQRAEAVGHALLGVVGDRRHRPLEAEHHGEGEHPGHQVRQVVTAAGQLDRTAEEIAEDEHQHDREGDPEQRRPGLTLPVLQVAEHDDPALSQGAGRVHRRPPSVVRSEVAGRSVRCRKTSSSVGSRSSTRVGVIPAASRARTTASRAAVPPAAPASTTISTRSVSRRTSPGTAGATAT